MVPIMVKSAHKIGTLSKPLLVVSVLAWTSMTAAVSTWAQTSATKTRAVSTGVGGRAFETPQQAADALIEAASSFAVDTLEEILGPEGDDIVLTGEYPQDRQRAVDFAAEAYEKKRVSVDPKLENEHSLSLALRIGHSRSR